MDLDTHQTYLLLGSNMGEREFYISHALTLIAEQLGVITAKSSMYETAAWGNTNQPAFLNQAIALTTPLNAITLLHAVLDIEKSLGRIRKEKWGARCIDIDVILFDEEIINLPGELQVPHPAMQDRKFVMQPLVEIAPALVHPVLGLSMSAILAQLTDDLTVQKL